MTDWVCPSCQRVFTLGQRWQTGARREIEALRQAATGENRLLARFRAAVRKESQWVGFRGLSRFIEA
jgi:hypothetical protein